jgi:recombination protein RecT
MQKSYFGQIAISKRVAGVKDVRGIPIYEGDVFKYTIDVRTGIKTVTQHDQEFDNIDPQKIKGAYAIVINNDDTVEYEIMSIGQIKTAWAMGAAGGNSKAHKNFPDQMAAKTVISRALKIPVNSSNDDDLFEEDGPDRGKQVAEGVKLEIQENANNASGEGAIGFEEDEPEALPASGEQVPAQDVAPSETAEQPQATQPLTQSKANF